MFITACVAIVTACGSPEIALVSIDWPGELRCVPNTADGTEHKQTHWSKQVIKTLVKTSNQQPFLNEGKQTESEEASLPQAQ